MQKKYFHQKLIRDRIPEKIKKSGGKYETRVLGNEEFEKEIKKKLIEESKELADSRTEELINELADVLELTKSIATHYKIPFSKVKKIQEAKRKQRGGFRKKLFLIWSTGKAGK
jgi:predicted house-cleaning noncanonical NTP pyrophosphatase (MazG superfamily)